MRTGELENHLRQVEYGGQSKEAKKGSQDCYACQFGDFVVISLGKDNQRNRCGKSTLDK